MGGYEKGRHGYWMRYAEMKGVKGYAQDMREKDKLPLKSVPFLDSLTPLRYYIHAALHGG